MVPFGNVKRDEKLNSITSTIFAGDGRHNNNHHLQSNNNNIVGVFGDDDKNNVVKGSRIAERRAATCGLNASNVRNVVVPPSGSQPFSSPLFTVPAGISPSALLGSPPVMLPNDQVQSPTTGTFQFNSTNPESYVNPTQKLTSPYGNGNFTTEISNVTGVQNYSHLLSKDFKSQTESPCQAFEELKCPTYFEEMAKKNSFVNSYSMSDQSLGNNKSWSELAAVNQVFTSHNDSNGKERSKNTSREKQQKGSSNKKEVSNDGYHWRKYGQKQVKGSEYPRSYYKCTNNNCEMKKKVECSHDGDVTAIVYAGYHNHERTTECGEENEELCITESEEDWRNDGLDREFSNSLLLGNSTDSFVRSTVPSILQELSPPLGSQEGDEKGECSPGSISLNNETGEGEPKRRKRDNCGNETNTISKSNREPRIVVQIESEIDILEDGYRWRKYGQKVVKGNPNPRSYYKCTTPNCIVRKHVERAANDIKSVITTYEGKHNHEVPSSKNNTNMVMSNGSGLSSNVNATNFSGPMTHQINHLTTNHARDFYWDQKPVFSCDELLRSNDLGFLNSSSKYPLSIPQIPSLQYIGSHFATTNHIMPFTTPYPMLSDFNTTMHTPMTRLAGPGNGYAAVQPASRAQEGYKDVQPTMMKRQ